MLPKNRNRLGSNWKNPARVFGTKAVSKFQYAYRRFPGRWLKSKNPSEQRLLPLIAGVKYPCEPIKLAVNPIRLASVE
jgi:hypothetical protein